MITELVTAMAALAAALFSGVSFFLSGRREEMKWKRDALLQTFEDYLNLSRARDHVADQIAAHLANGSKSGIDDLLSSEGDFHERQLDALTRLRMLARQDIVKTAEALHLADHTLIDAARHVSSEDDLENYQAKSRRTHSEVKVALLNAIRASLRLPADTRIHEGM